MTGDSEWLNKARARLAQPEPRRSRPDTIIARVEALMPEIQRARVAGKTWAQVAVAISDGAPLNADAVRVAFARASRVEIVRKVLRNSRGTSASVSLPDPFKTPNKPIVEEDSFPDMFGPMFDARDTRGRGDPDGPNEEARP